MIATLEQVAAKSLGMLCFGLNLILSVEINLPKQLTCEVPNA